MTAFDMVFLDVNGTLLPVGASTGPVTDGGGGFAAVVRDLQAMGVRVGLCSDSPVEQLRAFGCLIGLGGPGTFPVVAENGNVLAVSREPRLLVSFPAAAEIRATIAGLAKSYDLRQVADVVAPEFGGRPLAEREWAFGANRRASVSVFAPAEFIEAAGAVLADRELWDGVSVDVSPRHRYLGVHPYPLISVGKGRALTALAGAGHRVLMVGDTPADWVPAETGVRCAFVAGAVLPAYVRAAAWFCSLRHDLEGVVDVLDRLKDSISKGRTEA
jgi:predicted mannosyl-3-phosphoglycerate phosphatase (HAD superfamily)